MKRNYSNIKTLADLHSEVQRLKIDYQLKETALKQDTKLYFKQFTLGALFKKFATPNGLTKLDEKTNISGKVMSFVLPMLLNSTVFRGSGLLTKALGALVSGKLGKSLDAQSLTGIFNAIKSLFTTKKKTKQQTFVDYGIPPDSETY